jgi:hypothetical protein
MRLRLFRWLTRAGRGLMLVAALAFVAQSAIIIVSQAAAFSGSMPEPAVVLSGKIHIHGDLAANMHVHGGNNAPGHVHSAAEPDDDDAATGTTLFWSLGSTSIVLPVVVTRSVLFEVVGVMRSLPFDRHDGFNPDGPSRPPSTPGIA